jgi:hypothetical protein
LNNKRSSREQVGMSGKCSRNGSGTSKTTSDGAMRKKMTLPVRALERSRLSRSISVTDGTEKQRKINLTTMKRRNGRQREQRRKREQWRRRI